MLIEMGAVEEAEPVLVAGEVGRHLVEDNPDPRLMQGVDQEHEVLGGPYRLVGEK